MVEEGLVIAPLRRGPLQDISRAQGLGRDEVGSSSPGARMLDVMAIYA